MGGVWPQSPRTVTPLPHLLPPPPTPGAGCRLGATKGPGKSLVSVGVRTRGRARPAVRPGWKARSTLAPAHRVRSPTATLLTRGRRRPSALLACPRRRWLPGRWGPEGRRPLALSNFPTSRPQPPRLRSRGPCGASSAARHRVCLGRVSPPWDPAGRSGAGKRGWGLGRRAGDARV